MNGVELTGNGRCVRSVSVNASATVGISGDKSGFPAFKG